MSLETTRPLHSYSLALGEMLIIGFGQYTFWCCSRLLVLMNARMRSILTLYQHMHVWHCLRLEVRYRGDILSSFQLSYQARPCMSATIYIRHTHTHRAERVSPQNNCSCVDLFMFSILSCDLILWSKFEVAMQESSINVRRLLDGIYYWVIR